MIDIVAVRGADAAGGWLFTALRSLGMELRSIPLVAIALAAVCLALVGGARPRAGAPRRNAAPQRVGYSRQREGRMGTGGWIVLAIIVVIAIWAIMIYNGLVALRNRFKNAFAQIDVQLKRRYDLIPNLVETVKGYLKHERETLEAVIKARNQAVARGAGRGGQPRQPGGDAEPRRRPRARSPACSAACSRSPRPIPTSRPTRTCWRCRKSSPAPRTRWRSRARRSTTR